MNNGIDHNLSIDKNNKFFNHFNFCNCKWCQLYGLPVLNEIELNEGKRYWFEVPKNASTSIKNSGIKIFRSCKKDSYHPGKLYDEIDSDVVPLVVYNDPVKRFISLCNDYFSEKHYNFHSNFGKKLFLEWKLLSDEQSIEIFTSIQKLEFIFKNFKNITSSEEVHHFYPQTFFVDQLKFKNFELVSIQNVCERFGIDGRNWYNSSKKNIKLDHFTEDQINLLKEIYSEDYKFIEKYT
jgi:hypothetical protein